MTAEQTPEEEGVGTGVEDFRQAEWLAMRFRKEWRFDHRLQQWFGFDGTRWRADTTRRVHRAVHKAAVNALMNARGTEEQRRLFSLLQWPAQERALKALSTFEDYSTDGTDWDQNGMLLGLANGVYDFAANGGRGAFRKGHPDDLITKSCGVEYDEDAPDPERFDQFLDEIYAGNADMVAYMKRAIGALLVGGFMKAFLVLVGDTDTGKSTLIEVCRLLMGSYACPVTIKVFARPSFQGASNGHTRELMRMPGTRFVFAVESSEQTTLDETRLKAMTGGEKAILAAPYSKIEEEHDVMWCIWLGTNIDPKVRDESDATWERMQVIPHPVRFWKPDDPKRPEGAPLQDRALPAALKAELPGILRHAIGWAHEYVEDGLLPLPEAGREKRDSMQQEDELTEWFELFMTKEPGSAVGGRDAFQSYVNWTPSHMAVTNTKFGTLLGKRATEKKHTESGVQYVGIRLLTAAERSG